jgi:hypothetical protein
VVPVIVLFAELLRLAMCSCASIILTSLNHVLVDCLTYIVARLAAGVPQDIVMTACNFKTLVVLDVWQFSS